MSLKDWFIILSVPVLFYYVGDSFEKAHNRIVDTISLNNGVVIETFRSEVSSIATNIYRQRTLDEYGCGGCHNANNNPLPKGRLTYKSFVCFLDNTCRWVNNPNIMPTYNFDEEKMRHLFGELYD